MPRFRKKPMIIDAEVWNKIGDHEEVKQHSGTERYCCYCGKTMEGHGWLATLEGGHIVCPGDWIIRGVKGEYYPCKPDIFEQTYEYVNDDYL